MAAKPGRSPKKIEDGVPAPSANYKVGDVFADTKIVEIKSESAKPIGFVYAKRDRRKNLIFESAFTKKGELIGRRPVWDDYVHYMNPADYFGEVARRIPLGLVIPTTTELPTENPEG